MEVFGILEGRPEGWHILGDPFVQVRFVSGNIIPTNVTVRRPSAGALPN